MHRHIAYHLIGIVIIMTTMTSIMSFSKSILHQSYRRYNNNICSYKNKSLLHMSTTPSTTSSSVRISSNGESLDVNLIASNPDMIASHLKSRKSVALLDDLSTIGSLRTARNALIYESDQAKNTRKLISAQIGQIMRERKGKAGADADAVDTEIKNLKEKVEDANRISDDADVKLKEIDASIDKLFSIFPNLLDDKVPEGTSDADNPIVTIWGEDKRKIGVDGTYLWHDEIAAKLNGLDVDAAARISGARFSVLKGSVAKLERALSQYFLDFHVDRGYEEVSVPLIVSRSTLEGTGQLPKFEDDLFKVNHNVAGEDAFLIPTAEVPVTNLYRDQLLDADQLPIAHVCLTPSFRAEAGSYGRDTRGLLRQHQFYKVELVKICTPETSAIEHDKMCNDAEELLKSLELPYRKVLLCSGDIGFSARICYDIEVWLPGQQAYREISSISNCYDFQSRRMSLRYRTQPQGSSGSKDKSKSKTTAYPHTLNGSGVAVGRALVAILENYQDVDGSVIIPNKLRPYFNGADRIKPHSKVDDKSN